MGGKSAAWWRRPDGESLAVEGAGKRGPPLESTRHCAGAERQDEGENGCVGGKTGAANGALLVSFRASEPVQLSDALGPLPHRPG